MADNFGLKIGIEGEKEFKKALSEINQSFKVLGSEMKLVSSQFDKNDKSVQALSARNTVLNMIAVHGPIHGVASFLVFGIRKAADFFKICGLAYEKRTPLARCPFSSTI